MSSPAEQETVAAKHAWHRVLPFVWREVMMDEPISGADLVDIVVEAVQEYKLSLPGKRAVCHRCGYPVLPTDVEGYSYYCPVHDEDLYLMEVDNVEGFNEAQRISESSE